MTLALADNPISAFSNPQTTPVETVIFIHFDATDKDLAHKFKDRYKHTKQTSNEKMTDGGPDVQPASLVPHHVEEIQRHDITDGHDDHEQSGRGYPQPAVEDTQIDADNSKGHHQLQEEKGPLREGVEYRYKSVNALKGEGGYRRDVARAEKPRLKEEEEEQRDPCIC